MYLVADLTLGLEDNSMCCTVLHLIKFLTPESMPLRSSKRVANHKDHCALVERMQRLVLVTGWGHAVI